MTVKELTLDTISSATALAIADRYGEPEWLRQTRQAAWETFAATPWPTYAEESWRRTRLTGFNVDNFQVQMQTLPRLAGRRGIAHRPG